jgi:hypothetical protein
MGMCVEGEGGAEEAGGGGEEGEHAPQDGREEAALQQHDRDKGGQPYAFP